MHIAFIGVKGISAEHNGGGAEVSVWEIAKRLAEKGHQVVIYCPRPKRLAAGRSLFKNIRIIYLPSPHSKHFGMLLHVFFSAVLVAFSDADIVHFQSLGPSIFSFVPRLSGKKTIVTIHALDWKRKKWGYLARLFLRLCEYPAMFIPHKTIVVSKTLKTYFEARFKRRVYYIPNGVNPPAPEKPATPKEDKYILFVGRLVPEKGIHYLIQAFNGINTDFKLIIAGEPSFTGKYFDYLKKIASQNIKFVGFAERGYLEKLYWNAYLFVLPSEIEGLSIALLEAMSHARCVLTSDIPEFLEVAGGNGVYFKSGDYQDLRDKLKYLIGNPVLVKEKGLEFRKLVLERYSWDKITGEVEKIYA
ncbi:MAG: glycosyltransferase family 4 protein [Candidatus Omnitrophota bacterium]|jgi:glycosyltransferase involved in cell wall biosynthesis|nr:glycosyltransferase family 4 protein [Candidatus Omnitrophota bacterium]MDD5196994.1 glycosyltransferase family 4 protein [Candidatus Omnitrophota bacterium]MDD5518392.1 glycosyltransferase family 4 protein [Candidatus Omnitrophota bacterium]